MKNKLINVLKDPKWFASFIVVFGFGVGVYAFTAPPGGCTPGTCNNPLDVDFTNQTVTVSATPTASGHVANKAYVDASSVPVGAIMPFYLANCPTGWIPADGTNGTPDLRGVFVRGMETFDGGSSYNNRDSDRSGAGTLGSYQADVFGAHRHPLKQKGGSINDYLGGSNADYGLDTNGDGGDIGSAVGSAGGNETRPKNVALIYCMSN